MATSVSDGFWQALEQVKVAEEVGFSHVFSVEHHFLDQFSVASAPEVWLRLADEELVVDPAVARVQRPGMRVVGRDHDRADRARRRSTVPARDLPRRSAPAETASNGCIGRKPWLR